MKKQLIFNCSMPRAGSTLLQNILAQNPDMHATPTSGLVHLVHTAKKGYTENVEFKGSDQYDWKKHFFKFVKGGMESLASSVDDKKYFIDKSRGWLNHMDILSEIYKKPKAICMVRDMKGIMCSLEKRYRAHPEVLHNFDVKGAGLCTFDRVQAYSQTLPLDQAWKGLKDCFDRDFAKYIIFIRFEDLCEAPENILKDMYHHLDIPYFDHTFDNIEQVTHENDTLTLPFGDHKIRNNLKLPNDDTYDILGPEICKEIDKEFEWYQSFFKYI